MLGDVVEGGVLLERCVVIHEALCGHGKCNCLCVCPCGAHLLQGCMQVGGSLLKGVELGMEGVEGLQVLAPFVHIHLC